VVSAPAETSVPMERVPADVSVPADDVRAVVAAVVDPELPALTIEDLGILRDVTVAGDRVVVTITPTYLACPALACIADDIRSALSAAGHPDAEVRTQLSPPWTTDWITPTGRAKLTATGIAPPPTADLLPILTLEILGPNGSQDYRNPPRSNEPPACPQCAARDVDELSRFAATSCQSLWRCRSCGEPFNQIKAL
jgi:ring-1,2-phenylacetyl-CoA epoxidase subunit PaaD